MDSPPQFLVVDEMADGRFLFSRTLLRHYPQAVVRECPDLATALRWMRTLPLDGHGAIVVAHRTVQTSGRDLVGALRAVHAAVPIIWVDDPQEAPEAARAGATRFLDYNAWLLIGRVVEELEKERLRKAD